MSIEDVKLLTRLVYQKVCETRVDDPKFKRYVELYHSLQSKLKLISKSMYQ